VKSIARFLQPPDRCEYLEQQTWQLEYEQFAEISADEYRSRLLEGWRRFGHTLFRPQCPTCRACQALRVRTADFRPNRSQQRCRKRNDGVVELSIGEPTIDAGSFGLYRQYHHFQHLRKHWPAPDDIHPLIYIDLFVSNPFPAEQWTYRIDSTLVAIGYVDCLHDALSAIYFFYDPEQSRRGLGTYNILMLIDEAKRRNLPYLHLGYFVPGAPSMQYKANFRPFELLTTDSSWKEPFE
jgi:arginine-tRNA-protein transferase